MPHRISGRIGRNRYPEILRLIASKATANEIALRLGVDPETIRKFARRRGLAISRQSQALDQHPSWKGGTTKDRHGYILQRVDKAGPYGYLVRHARAEDSRGYAPQHRIAMHDKLGRRLEAHEVVHHIDGDVANNEPENLEIFATNADHLRATITGQVPAWSEAGWRAMQDAVHGPRHWTPEGLARLRAPRPHLRGENHWRHAKRDHPKSDDRS